MKNSNEPVIENSKSKASKRRRKSAIKKIDPPFGYFGSKNKIAFQLCENLPPHNCWVEGFCGSAAVTLAKPPAPIEIINDVNDDIINLFEQLRDNKDALCEQVALTPYANQELVNARNNIDAPDLERARRFLVKSMMAVNGVFGKEKGGFSISNSYTRNGKEARVSRWYNLPARLEIVADRLKNARIEKKDAVELLKKYTNRPATLVYLDPPYLGKRTNGYDDEANDYEFHKLLLETANNAKCMIFISGYENDLYNSMLSKEKGWEELRIATSTRGVNGLDNLRTEVVWMNKYYLQALNSKEAPVKLTKKESKQKKVNPERKS
ncbi:DNA adenine methylase [Reichenbachiella sp.]|uniref:DNA adenine methylase n=1 Tax=Reichenbachiella sp. TaxID=2184521 RepID=UPI003298461C